MQFDYTRMPRLTGTVAPFTFPKGPAPSPAVDGSDTLPQESAVISVPLARVSPGIVPALQEKAAPPVALPEAPPLPQTQTGSAISWSNSNHAVLQEFHPQAQVSPPIAIVDAAPPQLSSWLSARARPVFSAQTLDGVASGIQPLVDLLSGPPDPKRWNEATWRAFQLSSDLSPEALTTAAQAIGSERIKPGQIPFGLQLSLADPQVDRDTLTGLMRARAFASQIVEGELPSLLPAERKNYMELVHDHGYANEQLARTRDPHSLLCPGHDPELLDQDRLSLLPNAVAGRFADEARCQASGESALRTAMPKLTLGDFFASDRSDAQSSDYALAFLQRSGKDVNGASAELGDKSMRDYLQKSPAESREQWLGRLSGKQIFNPLGRSWKDLSADVGRLEKGGAPGGELLSQLEKKQTPALAPTLLVLNAPSLFESAAGGASLQTANNLDTLMQVFWRATNPQLPFSDPLVSSGRTQLAQTHQEQLAKDRQLWSGVVSLKKTSVLAGLSDELYSARSATLPQKPGIEQSDDGLKLAFSRLERDLGPDHPALEGLSQELEVTQLHASRFDPRSFAITVPKGQESFSLGGSQFKFQASDGQLLPEFVSATTVAYRVEVGSGESGLLRLPKGATPSIDAQGNLQLNVFDPQRFQEVSNRLKDYQFMDSRVAMTGRKLLECSGGAAVLEDRAAQMDAGRSLKDGAQLHKRDADALVDQWLSGTAESDPATRPYGVFYELGPDNYVLGKNGLEGSYVDVAMAFRNERERSSFGFVGGGYGSAANWIVADNQPMSRQDVARTWQGSHLTPPEAARRQLFVDSLQERRQPDHPVWASLPPAKRDAAYVSFLKDVDSLGLVAGEAPGSGEVAPKQRRL